jgi:hypothetical protein
MTCNPKVLFLDLENDAGNRRRDWESKLDQFRKSL